MPDEGQEISAGSVFLGFVIGMVLSLVLSGLGIVGGMMLGAGLNTPHRQWVFPLVNAVLIVGAGAVALRSFQSSGIARGIVIALAMAFVLNGVCGLAVR
jgi:hypothetical protein